MEESLFNVKLIKMESNKSLQQHIEDNINELDNPDINSQRKRHLESELELLQQCEKDGLNIEICDY